MWFMSVPFFCVGACLKWLEVRDIEDADNTWPAQYKRGRWIWEGRWGETDDRKELQEIWESWGNILCLGLQPVTQQRDMEHAVAPFSKSCHMTDVDKSGSTQLILGCYWLSDTWSIYQIEKKKKGRKIEARRVSQEKWKRFTSIKGGRVTIKEGKHGERVAGRNGKRIL